MLNVSCSAGISNSGPREKTAGYELRRTGDGDPCCSGCSGVAEVTYCSPCDKSTTSWFDQNQIKILGHYRFAAIFDSVYHGSGQGSTCYGWGGYACKGLEVEDVGHPVQHKPLRHYHLVITTKVQVIFFVLSCWFWLMTSAG